YSSFFVVFFGGAVALGAAFALVFGTAVFDSVLADAFDSVLAAGFAVALVSGFAARLVAALVSAFDLAGVLASDPVFADFFAASAPTATLAASSASLAACVAAAS